MDYSNRMTSLCGICFPGDVVPVSYTHLDVYKRQALNRVGLSKEVNKKVYQLSGGEQQRVALARLMMKKCSVDVYKRQV